MKSLAQYKNIIAVIAVILVFIFLMKQMIEKNSVAMRELEAQKSELDKGKELILKWEAGDRQMQEISRSFMKDSSTFRSLVEESAQKSGITVDSLTPSKQEKDFYSEAKIDLKATAKSYSEIINFINAIDNENIITDGLRMKNDQGKRTIDVTFKVFILNN